MIELGAYEPRSVINPSRTASGTQIGRLTTTEEQRSEIIEWAVAQLAEHKGSEHEGRATINWPSDPAGQIEPTIFEVRTTIEHMSGKKVWVFDQLREFTLAGGEIPQTEEHRIRRLTTEVAELHERGML